VWEVLVQSVGGADPLKTLILVLQESHKE